jgi:hypothetical protein
LRISENKLFSTAFHIFKANQFKNRSVDLYPFVFIGLFFGLINKYSE